METTGSWFDTARLGMFVHWSHSSQHGCELSWPLVGGVSALPTCVDMPVETYHSTARTFNPESYDPAAWARIAKASGMQYAVLTAKHHDGYAMYRFGAWRRSSEEEWARFLKFMFAQVRELLTDYGTIDMIWFDGGWERTTEEWRAAELYEMIRSLQPDILINDRLPGFGDFDTPEQFVPPQPPERVWETCMTIVHTLCEIAGRGGNFLLNVAPMADGRIQPELLERRSWTPCSIPTRSAKSPSLSRR